MDTGSCVILRAAADLFHCECLPVRIGQTPGKGRKQGEDESWSRWTVLYREKKNKSLYLFIYLVVELGACGGDDRDFCAALG